jgi:SAM-dependent methyltransferase
MKFTHNPEVYNTNSAKGIVSPLFEFIQPKSVIDVGCGIGTWLSVFKEFGIDNVVGVDGEHVNREQLFSHIREDEFIAHDLTKPLELERRFDLVVSLEVAEHIPEEVSDIFIESLTRLGDYILFSAAIPGQGGDGHINEQWPSYWQEKFNRLEFYDCIRPKIWSNVCIDWWYKQNIFLVSRRNFQFPVNSESGVQELVHPDHYLQKIGAISKIERDLENIYQGKSGLRLVLKLLWKTIRYTTKLQF